MIQTCQLWFIQLRLNKSYSMLIHFMKCINILYGEIKKYEIAHDHHEYIEIINCILNIGVSYIDVLNQFLAQLRLRILFSHDDEHELAKHSEFISFFVKNVDVFVLRIIRYRFFFKSWTNVGTKK